jgi:hypothetical protein
MDSHVGSPNLPSARQSELVLVRGKVAKAVQGGRGAVGDDSLVWLPLPGKGVRGELEPRRPQRDVIWSGRAGQVVHAVAYALENPIRAEPLQGGG